MVKKLRLFLRENKLLRKTIYPFVFWLMTDVLKWKQHLIKKYGYQAVDLIHQAAVEVEMPYFPDCGTLLGFVRDGGFIAHDADMDFSMMPDNGRVAVFFETLEKKGFYFERYITIDGKLREFTMRYREISIDFFQRRYGDDKSWFYVLGENEGDYYQCGKKVVPKGFMPFVVHGVTTRIPTNYDEMLSAMYGNWHVKIKDWDDKMSPSFEKDYTKHVTYLSRKREEWIKYMEENKL